MIIMPTLWSFLGGPVWLSPQRLRGRGALCLGGVRGVVSPVPSRYTTETGTERGLGFRTMPQATSCRCVENVIAKHTSDQRLSGCGKGGTVAAGLSLCQGRPVGGITKKSEAHRPVCPAPATQNAKSIRDAVPVVSGAAVFSPLCGRGHSSGWGNETDVCVSCPPPGRTVRGVLGPDGATLRNAA